MNSFLGKNEQILMNMFVFFIYFLVNENPGLGLGFQKAYSVVLKKLFRDAKIIMVRQPKSKQRRSF